jgi:molybdopterin-dependent oxidoreductase alpha subunit
VPPSSCAWADPALGRRKHAEFCENGAKSVAWEATRKRVDAAFFARHPVSFLREQSDHWLEANGRLTEPVYLAPGADRYVPIGWDEALAKIAGRLKSLADPNRAVFYTSGRASNEAAFVYQLLARRLGTNNLPDCSNMCHESSGAALTETIGIGKGQVTIEDISDHADLIVVVGQNPGTNHPRMLTALEEAKRRGAKIVAVNPLPEAGLIRFKNPQQPRGLAGRGTKLADRFLPVRVNGDLALFAGVNKLLTGREEESPGRVLDNGFIDRHTEGFAAAAAAWAKLDWADIERLSGLSRREIAEFADDVIAAGAIVVCWAMGLTQHKNAVPTIREVMNFLLLRGNIGRPGAGPCPVRGHSNVQGDRTMGIYEKMPDSFLDAVRDEFGFEPPRPAASRCRGRRTTPARSRRRAARRGSRSTRCRRSRCPRAICCCRPSARTTSSTRPCTGSTTGTGASTADGTSCSCRPPTWTFSGSRTGTWSTWSACGPTASGAPAGSAWWRTRPRRAAPPPTSPRPTCWSRWTQPRTRPTPRPRSL